MELSELRIGAKRILYITQICMIFLVSVVTVSWGLDEDDENVSETKISARCTFSTYLQDPANRARYRLTVAKARNNYVTARKYDNPAMYGVIANASITNENSENLDSFSAGCLSCHDGKTASNVRPNLTNNPGNKNRMVSISGKHPIGMDYEKYAIANHNLKSLDEISINLSLAEGRVSCITCHDPLNAEQNHLMVTRTGIDLCSVCHKM